MNSTIKELLKRPVAVPPALIKAFGSVKLAILWSQFYYWSSRTTDKDGWIYKTHEQIFEETGLTRKEIMNAQALGKKLKVLEVKRCDYPAKNYFRVMLDETERVIELYIQNAAFKGGSLFPEKTAAKKEKKGTIYGYAVVIQGNTLPPWLNTKVWNEWCQYRKEKKKPLTAATIKKQIEFLSQFKDYHIGILESSIRNGWIGLFPPNGVKAGMTEAEKKSEEERLAWIRSGSPPSEFSKKLAERYKMPMSPADRDELAVSDAREERRNKK